MSKWKDYNKKKKDMSEIKDDTKELVLDLVASYGDLIPFVPVGTILKDSLKIVSSYRDFRFFKKLDQFLNPTKESEDFKGKVEVYLNHLSDNERQKLVDYLMGLLDGCESDDKTLIMGYIYKASVLKNIDHRTMLRLCSIIRSMFISDLKCLPLYVNECEEDTIETQSFVNLGLIDNEPGGRWINKPTYELNELGMILYEILTEENYFSE